MRKFAAFGVALSVTLLLVLLPSSMLAQTVTGSLTGQVTDASGAVLPEARVTLKDEATGSTHTAVSNGAGYFNFQAVFPGTYDVRVTATGFEAWEVKGIVLHQNESRSVANIALKPGAANEQVTVEAGTETVPVDSGASSTTLNNTMVDQTAIQGRDAAELIRLMPGMAINSGLSNSEWNSAVTQINNGPIGNFSANGTQPNGSMQLISNGSVITDAGNQGTQIANVNQDMTQEVTLQNSSFDAEYAHGPITFSAVGKRGTNAFHGEAYGYMRNGSLNSMDAFLHAERQQCLDHNGTGCLQKPIDHYWYEGGNIGGSIFPHTHLRDKAFFFFGFEHLHQQTAGVLHQYVVPTGNWISGDFTQPSLAPYVSAFGNGAGSTTIPCNGSSGNYNNFCQSAVGSGQISMYDPNGVAYSGSAYNSAVAAFQACNSAKGPNCNSLLLPISGSTINSGIDPNGQILMKLLAGAPGLSIVNPASNKGYNANFLDAPPVNGNEMNIRGDVNITEKMKAFATYTRQTEADINNIGLWWWAGDAVPYPSQTPASQLSRAYSFGVTNTISPVMINEASFGYAYFINPVTLKNATAANPSTSGYNVTTPYAQPVPQIPDIVSWCCASGGGNSPSANIAAGFNASSFGSSPNWYGKAAGKDSYTPDFSDTFTWVKSSHEMKFGFFWARYANVQTEGACCGGGTVGQWEFDPWTSNGTGNLYADMLLGHATGYSMASENFTDNVVYNEYSFFAQDKWKATRRMTLSFGVRFNREGQWYPTNENKGIMVWDPNNSVQPYSATSTAPLAGFVWHGIDSKIPVSGWPTHSFYPDPRVGIAYDLFGNGRTVLRGGFGMYRFNVAYNSVTANGLLDGPLGLKNFGSNCTFNNLAALGTCGAASAGARNSQTYEGMQLGDNAAPYTQTWNVMVDQRAPWHSTFEVQYSGNRSRNLMLSPNGNGGVPISNINYIAQGGLFQPDPVTGITYYCQGTASSTCVTGAPPSGALPDYRPYGYSKLYLLRHESYSNYNGMIVQWIKQSGPVVLNLNYTWSHALGIRDGNNDNGQGAGAALDAFNLRSNYGDIAYNRFHIINASYVLSLPTLIHGNAFLGQAVNGWKLSGVTQFQTGVPLQPLTNGNLFASYGGGESNQSILGTDGIVLMPYLSCNPASHLQSGQYFNPSCFTAPTQRGVNGPFNWPTLTGPGFFTSDLGVYKDFKISESQGLEFRFTAFDFMNHANTRFGLTNDINLTFAGPGAGNGNPQTTGRPAFEVGNRSLEFALKYHF